MSSKKRAYLQQFGIIHVPNPDLTYIRNPEREIKLYLYPSTSWKIKSGTLLCYLFLFSPSHLTRNHDANRAPRAYIYALEAGFSQITKNWQVFCQTVGGVFLTFLPKIKDGNSICQIAGDALSTPARLKRNKGNKFTYGHCSHWIQSVVINRSNFSFWEKKNYSLADHLFSFCGR